MGCAICSVVGFATGVVTGNPIGAINSAVNIGSSLFGCCSSGSKSGSNTGASATASTGSSATPTIANMVPQFLCSTAHMLTDKGPSTSSNTGLAAVDPSQLQEAAGAVAPTVVEPNANVPVSDMPLNANIGQYNPYELDVQQESPLKLKSGGLAIKKYDQGDSVVSSDTTTTGLPTKDAKPTTLFGKLTCGFAGMQQGLKCAVPKFADSHATVLRGSGGAPHSTELQSLKQIRPCMSGYAEGGLPHKYHAAAPKGHNPEFITGITGYYACGGGTGQSDDIPAMLHDGDYVMDAETVSALGDGSSKAGMHVLDGFRTRIPHHDKVGENPVPAKIADGEYVFPASFVTALGKGDNKHGAEILDGLREKLREHKRGAPTDKIPPKAKSPLDYIKKGKA
jgi:hypothetical protein